MDDITDNAVKTLLQAGKNLGGIDFHMSSQSIVDEKNPTHISMAVPEGVEHVDITAKVLARMPTPRRRTGNMIALSPASLIDYVNRYAEESRTVIFANSTVRTVTAIMNHHDPLAVLTPGETDTAQPVKSVTENPLPQWGDFRSTYSFPLSRQWKVWSGIDGKPAGQFELAQFFEDNIRDIADPDTTKISATLQLMIDRLSLRLGAPSRILEVARGMEVRSTEKVRNAINTDTGEQIVTYEQDHASGNPTVTELRVPTAFLLTIPVFQNDAPYLLLCRLRYRKVEGGLKWIVNIQGADAALEDAFKRGCDTIQAGTGVPLFYGEAPAVATP